VADRYVQLTTPVESGAHLADGAVIPTERTATPVEIDRLYKSLDEVATVLGPKGANKDGALSDLVGVAANNLKGNGARTRTLLTNLGAAARTLSDSDEDAFAAAESLDKLAKVMQSNDGHVRSVATRVARVTGVLADDRKTIEAALTELASALTLVQDFVHDNRTVIAHSVVKLSDATAVLAEQRAALGQILGALPPAIGGLLGAYDSARNVLVGRADPLDATLGHAPDLGGVQDHAPPKLPYPMPGGTP
jgi:virulence factor Mce-like protein